MDNDLRRELRGALGKFETGVQVAVTISCFAIGTSLGVAIASSTSPIKVLIAALAIGTVAAVTASYSMYRAELRQTKPIEDIGGENRNYDGSNETHYGRLDL